MKRLAPTLLTLSFAMLGCVKLDFMIYPGEKLDSYGFQNYEGEQELELPSSYDIPDSLVHHMTTTSTIDGVDEATVHMVYIGDLSTISTDTVIVYCHGQAKHMDYYWNKAALLAHTGGLGRFGVLMMDYRGYGMSEGSSNEAGLYADVDACLSILSDMGVTGDQLIMYGFSLGSVPATELTAYPRSLTPEKLILESPMASAQNLAESSTVINFQSSFLAEAVFNNGDKIQDVDQPLLWMHGTADDYLNIENGEVIYARHQGAWKQAIRVEGAKHGQNGVAETMGLAEYNQAILDYITRP